MKFLIDNQLPVALQIFLSGKGHDAEHVLELGMAEASDLEVSQYASRDGRTIIAKDEDFSVLRMRPGSGRWRNEGGLRLIFWCLVLRLSWPRLPLNSAFD
jgi:hypothetical protein